MDATRELCCVVRAALGNLCCNDEDLASLGLASAPAWGFSERLAPRLRLQHRFRVDPGFARRLADRLDLRHADAVLAVRGADEARLEARVERWVEHPVGDDLPGLLWALCSDRRPGVQRLGVRLAHEAITAACLAFVARRSERFPSGGGA